VHTASFDTPDAEIAALRALLSERAAVVAEREAELRNATFEIEKLKVQLAALRRDRYGKSSEKLAAETGQLAMLIGDAEEDQAQAAAAAEAKARTKGQPGNQRRPALRRPLPEHLPRETVLHEPVFACVNAG
jgi:septal ring factor EnvC (AmiA/AmiB activator)